MIPVDEDNDLWVVPTRIRRRNHDICYILWLEIWFDWHASLVQEENGVTGAR
jgi:hypothetical protein